MEDGDGRFSNVSISELISILRTSFRMSVFDKVEKVLVARERRLKKELKRKKKECEFLRRKKHISSLDVEKDKSFELEHAKKGVEDKLKLCKRRCEEFEPRVSLLENNFPKMSDWEANMVEKFETSSEQLGTSIGEMIREEQAPEKCKNANANLAEGNNEGKVTGSDEKEQIAPAETFCKSATSSRTFKVDHVINLQEKPGVKRKHSLFANSLDEKVDMDDDDKITESSKPSKEPQGSNTVNMDDDDKITESSKPSKETQGSNMDPGVILVEASSCSLNETKKMITWTKQGGSSSKVCEENSLLKPFPRYFCVDSDDDDSLDDSSSSSDSDDDTHPLLFNELLSEK